MEKPRFTKEDRRSEEDAVMRATARLREEVARLKMRDVAHRRVVGLLLELLGGKVLLCTNDFAAEEWDYEIIVGEEDGLVQITRTT